MKKISHAIVDDSHKHNPEYWDKYDDNLKAVLKGKKTMPVTHTLNLDQPVNFKAEHRILDLTKGEKYGRRKHTYKPALHWGQLKLFLSEVEFLTTVLRDVDDKQIWFVYAGAAPGHHIQYLSDLFPMINFELYDPNDFVVKDTAKIKTHVQFFTDKDAEHWHDMALKKNNYVVFCSDIRSEPATPENVARNMEMQMKWWQIINPELSMFKFRLPWEPGTTEYPEGDIYIQAFPGPTSTETRLIFKKNAKLIQYDNQKYEEACYYFNTITRMKRYKTVLGDLVLQRDGVDMCYDCASFIHIMHEYVKVTGKQVKTLPALLKEVQKEISFGKFNIYTRSMTHFSDSLNELAKLSYIACRNKSCKVCPNGLKHHHKATSKATIENEENNYKKVTSGRESFNAAKRELEKLLVDLHKKLK